MNKAFWIWYENSAFRTNANLGDEHINNLHMLSGMITEIGELTDVFKKELAYGKERDWKNIKEEVGDIFWYIAGFVHFNPIFRDSVVVLLEDNVWMDDTHAVMDIEASLEMASDLGHFLHEYIDLNHFTLSTFNDFFRSLLRFCKMNDFDVQRIMENNIEKLIARYPDKFTPDNANNRNLEREEQVLDD